MKFKYFKRLTNGIIDQIAYFKENEYGELEFLASETFSGYDDLDMSKMESIDIQEFREILRIKDSFLAKPHVRNLPLSTSSH